MAKTTPNPSLVKHILLGIQKAVKKMRYEMDNMLQSGKFKEKNKARREDKHC